MKTLTILLALLLSSLTLSEASACHLRHRCRVHAVASRWQRTRVVVRHRHVEVRTNCNAPACHVAAEKPNQKPADECKCQCGGTDCKCDAPEKGK